MYSNTEIYEHIKLTEAPQANFFTNKNSSLQPAYIRKLWMQLSTANEYASLDRILTLAKEQGFSTEDFFLKEGRLLLNWAIVIQADFKPFEFICSNVIKTAIANILSQDNFSIIKTFLIGESGLDDSHLTSSMTLKYRIEKFKLLLIIDAETKVKLRSFMEQTVEEKKLSKEVKNSIREAIIEYENKSNLQLTKNF